MCALKLVSDIVPKVTDKTFKRKYIALGRVVTHWEDIMGEKMAQVAQPLKLHYRKAKRKGDKPTATLDVAVSSAQASLLIMQKGVLLEKINHVFGEQWITDIKFVHNPISMPEKPQKTEKILSNEKKDVLSSILDVVEDAEIKARLKTMGRAVLSDQ